MLSSRMVSREKGITRATQGKKDVGIGVSGGTGEGCVGLHTRLRDYATPVVCRWAPLDHSSTCGGRNARTRKSVQMSQKCVNVLIFGLLICNSVHILKIRINHIGFNAGLSGINRKCTSTSRVHLATREM